MFLKKLANASLRAPLPRFLLTPPKYFSTWTTLVIQPVIGRKETPQDIYAAEEAIG
jgi:hypothetical protein